MSGVFRFEGTIEVERRDAAGQIENGALLGEPIPVRRISIQGFVRAPATHGRDFKAAVAEAVEAFAEDVREAEGCDEP